MGRRSSKLTLDLLEELPGHSAECVFWQLDPVRRARVAGHEHDELRAWTSTVLREWGACGRVLHVDDEYAGHVLWAPSYFAPGASGFATAPPSSDAVLMLTAHVDPRWRGTGLGRVLVQQMAKDLIRRGDVRAVEAFGADPAATGPDCVLPVGYLLAVGFASHREHPRHPRMRMELRSAISWRDEVEAALERLLPTRGLRPAPRPAERATR